MTARRIGMAVMTAALTATLLAAPAGDEPTAEAATTYRAPLRKAINQLNVKPETPAGYDRDKFNHWIDANGDCQDTRAEVLIQESKVQAKPIGGCTVKRGRWVSYYDGKTWTLASDVDIDHLVPLKEAWDSGAKKWNAATRKRFSNDLGDRRSLVAVTDNVNQSKGAGDPADWMPAKMKCRYIKEWVAVKHRWKLSINGAEKTKLHQVRKNLGCSGWITVTKAKTVNAGGGGGTPPPASCHPAYTPCVPPPPPDLNCGDIDFVVYVNHAIGDPHGFDGDKDGVGCEGNG